MAQESLLARIYGVFRVSFQAENVQYQFFMQKNLCPYPRKYVLRVYDLKGSTTGRQVLDHLSAPDRQPSFQGKTLKDNDFDNLEPQQRLILSAEDCARLVELLQRDTRLLESCELIDYSLLLVKLDLGQYCEDHQLGEPQAYVERLRAKNPLDRYRCLASAHEPGVYYLFAVIDYLMNYSNKKALESRVRGSQASAQPPKVYADRFLAMIRRRITSEPNDMFQIASSQRANINMH